MTIGTLLCPRCGHNNAHPSQHCAKCKLTMHLQPAETEDNRESDETYRHPTLLPWIMAGCGFAFIAALLFVSSNRSLPTTPNSFTFYQPSSEPLPEPEAPSATSIVVAPNAPAGINRPQSNWLPVADFSGDGASRSRLFVINSPHWRIRWQAQAHNVASDGTKTWFYAFIYRNDGKRMDLINNTQAEASNTLRLKNRGTYYIDVNATQNWSLKIEEWR